VVPSYSPIYSPYLSYFHNAASFEDDEEGSLQEHGEAPDVGKAHVRGPESRTARDLWQEYAHGLCGHESLREKEKHGKKWRQDPIDPKTGKRKKRLRHFWNKCLPIYLFIEMRIDMGDSEAVAVETCQFLYNFLTEDGCQNWNVLSPLLRGVLRQEESAVTKCQHIFNEYLTRKGHPRSGIVGDQPVVLGSDKRTVRDFWHEYAHGLNGQEPLREKERRGTKWRRDPIDPKTGKRGHTLKQFWSNLRPIYLFIEMRIDMGDIESLAVETCQEIAKCYLTRNGSPNWNLLCPLLRGVLGQEENAVTRCQQIFNAYLTRNGRPITGIVGDQVQDPSRSTVDEDFWNVRVSDSRAVHAIWQEYAHGINGQEPLREKERRGKEWRHDPVDPRTGKRGSKLSHLWSKRRPIFLFIEMRIAMGDSETVAVETCQEIVNNYLTRSGCPDWTVLSPLLRGVLDQEKDAVTTVQKIFNKYLTRNGRPISGLVDPQQQRSS
jgi:hypothetical protein